MATIISTVFKIFPVAFLLFAISLGYAAEPWVPPQDPDPEEIRRGADKDFLKGRYELASQKYVWYHENALKYRPALLGVRVSFALIGWRNLGEQYPPALQEMKRARDKAEERVRQNGSEPSASKGVAAVQVVGNFQDAAALNRVLKEDDRTIELFKWLSEHDPDLAHLAYAIAQDALVEAGEFALCETYLTGRNSFDEVLKDLKRHLKWVDGHYGGVENAPHVDSHYQIFARKVAYIVAILVNRNRLSDAEIIAEKATHELQDENLRNQIDEALQGIPPGRLM